MAKSRFLNRYVHSVRLSVSRPTCQYFLSFELGNYVVFISFFILFYFLFKQFICMNIATNKNCFPRKILPCDYQKFYMIKKIYFKLSKPVKCRVYLEELSSAPMQKHTLHFSIPINPEMTHPLIHPLTYSVDLSSPEKADNSSRWGAPL